MIQQLNHMENYQVECFGIVCEMHKKRIEDGTKECNAIINSPAKAALIACLEIVSINTQSAPQKTKHQQIRKKDFHFEIPRYYSQGNET